MTDNPMIADNRPASTGPFRNLTGQDALEGAGPLSGFASAVQNMQRGDSAGAWVDIGGIGFDALGAIQDPLRVGIAAGIGWLVEHVGVFNEILSVMAGDPNQVADHAQTWTNIGDHVTSRVRDLQNSVSTLTAASYAADGYRTAVNDFARAVVLSGEAAHRAADGTNTAATVVATTRSVIRDSFADWMAGRVKVWIGLGPLTPVTFGGAQAAFLADSLVSGARLASHATRQLRTLVRNLDEMAAVAKAGSDSLTGAADALRKAARGMDNASTTVTRTARAVGGEVPAIPGEGALVGRMRDLGAAAGGRVAEVDEAARDVASAAARRAETGQKIGGRKAPRKDRVNEAAHAEAKRRQKAADARLAGRASRLPAIADEAGDLASEVERVADDAVAGAKKAIRPSFADQATGIAEMTAKEAIVQSSNEDMRAENAERGYQDQQPERKPTIGPVPGEIEVDENLPPGEPPTAGPAPRPVRQETWQVRGTLDP